VTGQNKESIAVALRTVLNQKLAHKSALGEQSGIGAHATEWLSQHILRFRHDTRPGQRDCHVRRSVKHYRSF
jgi:hypothetical protein